MRTTSRFARIFGFALTVSFLTTSLPAMVASYFFLPEVDDEVVLGFNAVTTLSLSIVAELEDGLSEHDLNLVCDVVNVDGDPSTHVTIDNEPPGEPSQKTVTLVHQEPVSFSIGLIPVDSFFDIADALRLRIHGDLNGDNVLETLATTRLSAAPPTPSLQIEPLQGPVVEVSAGKEIELSYTVTNLGAPFVWDSVADILRKDGSDGGPVGSIDGLSPGQPSPRSIALGEGESATVSYAFIPAKSFFDIADAVGIHIQSDLDGNNVLETLTSTTLGLGTVSGRDLVITELNPNPVLISPNEQVTLRYSVTNNGDETVTFPWRTHENGGVFTVEGREPGEPLESEMTLGGGETAELSYWIHGVDSFFDIYERATMHFEAALAGNGEFTTVASTVILPLAVIDWNNWHGESVAARLTEEVTLNFTLANNGTQFTGPVVFKEHVNGGVFNAEFFRLDGMGPGGSVQRDVSVAGGDSIDLTLSFITVDSFFDIEYKVELIAETDLDGDGIAEVLGTTTVLPSFDVAIEPAEGQGDSVEIVQGEPADVTFRIIDGFGVDSFFDIAARVELDDGMTTTAKHIDDWGIFFRIDGLPEGMASTKSVSVPAGGSTEVSFSVTTVDSFFDLELRPPVRLVVTGDLDGDGAEEELTSTRLEASASEPVFLRGDIDLSGVVDTTDGINILVYLFLGGFTP